MAKATTAPKTYKTDTSPRAVFSYKGQTYETIEGKFTTDDPDMQAWLEDNSNFYEAPIETVIDGLPAGGA